MSKKIDHTLRIKVFDPYSPAGGGGQGQAGINNILKRCFPEGDVQAIPMGNPEASRKSYIHQTLWSLRYCCRGFDADLIILQSYLTLGTIVLGHYARKHNIPYILIPHGDLVPSVDLWHITKRPVAKWLMWLIFARQFLNHAAVVITTSEMEKQRLQSVGASNRRFHVIPNMLSFPTPEYIENDKDLDCEKDGKQPLALWLGRVASEKGLELLLECWPEVLSICPAAKLILAGPVSHPRTFRRLQGLQRSLHLEGAVEFIGWVGGEEKHRLLAQARCLVLPSHFESFGNVVVEALSMQTPVVASNETPWPQIDGVAGRWLPRDPHIWARAISCYLLPTRKLKVPPKDVARLLAPYSESNLIERWDEVFRTILNNRRNMMHTGS